MRIPGTHAAGRTAALAIASTLVVACGLGQDGLPPAYVGSWTGTVHDDSPPGFDYTFDANIHGGSTGEIVGTFAYPCCGGNLRLLEVGESSVELAEEYTYNPCGCITTNARERLVVVDEDTLRLEWHYAGETRIWVYGDLERRGAGFETETIAGYLVTAPNGNRLWTKVIQPRQDVYGGLRFPAVVSVPGLTDAGENDDLHVAANGVIEFHFNAEGRGQAHRSDGSENLNGFVHQDDLKAVIQFAQSRPNVLLGNFGVVTFSYGVTMGAGCLARYPDLGVKYLIDREGPGDSYVTGAEPWALDGDPSNDAHQWLYDYAFHHYSIARDPSPGNVAFWSERQATLFIGSIACRYLRIQAEWDHVQPPTPEYPTWDYPPLWYAGKHAVDLVNLATLGSASWTRMNGSSIGNAPNRTYSREDPPVWYAGSFSSHARELERVILEMVEMPPDPADCNQNGTLDELDISSGTSRDCNQNGVPDECDLLSGRSHDCNANGAPDECDIASGGSPDCNGNGVPDECELASGQAPDCNANGTPDVCDIASGSSLDCNQNGVPDPCDLASGRSYDCDEDGRLDDCQVSPFPSIVSTTTGLPDSTFVGPPDAEYTGLGSESVTYDLGPARAIDGPGVDFSVYEGGVSPLGAEFPVMDVLVSDDGQGFRSVKGTESALARIPGDAAQPRDGLGRSYDVGASGLAAARYIRIQGTESGAAGGGRGFDLDAVGILHLALCRGAPELLRGDSNADGAIDISDALATLGFLFLGEPPGSCDDAADANDDGVVDLSDAVSTLGFLFLGGPAPPAPFGDCGTDPSEDGLGCDRFASCP